MIYSVFRPQGGVTIIAEPANTHNGSAEYLAQLITEVRDRGGGCDQIPDFRAGSHRRTGLQVVSGLREGGLVVRSVVAAD